MDLKKKSMYYENKKDVMFKPGDIVRIKHSELQNTPINMLITQKVTDCNKVLLGMKCLWFDKEEVPHEMVISTKDLELVKASE